MSAKTPVYRKVPERRSEYDRIEVGYVISDDNLWVRRVFEVTSTSGHLERAQTHVEQGPRAVGPDALGRCGAARARC